jgi:hypothetical protein
LAVAADISETNLSNRPSSADRALGRVAAVAQTHWRPLVILALSLVMTAIYAYGNPYILYNDSDPLAYFMKAWWLVGVGGSDVPSRGPGYPIWLLLTGAASLATWWGLVVSQLAMAASSPVLVYAMLAPVLRNAAFAAALLFLMFGISYVHMNWVMTEELFLFVELVALVLMSRYLAGAGRRGPESAVPGGWAGWRDRLHRWLATPYPIAVLLVYDAMVKPAASVFFWIFLFVCLLLRVERWQRYVGPTVLYVALMTAWGLHDYYRGPVRFPTLAQPGSQAQRYFADVYYGDGFGAAEGGAPTIRPQDGPASERLYRAVSTLIAADRASGRWNISDETSARQLYGRFPTDELLQNIFTHPNPIYFQLVVGASASDGGDELLHAVAGEHGNTGLRAIVRYLVGHPTVPFMGPPNPYVGYMFLMKYFRFRDFVAVGQFAVRNLFAGSSKENMIQEQNGPGSKAFADSLRYFIDTFPQLLHLTGLPDYHVDFRNLDEFQNHVVETAHFSGAMMGYLYQWLSQLYGDERVGRLMGRAAVEATLKNPDGPGLLLGDFLTVLAYSGSGYLVPLPKLLTDFSDSFSAIRHSADSELVDIVKSGHPTALPQSLAVHVGNVHDQSEISKDIYAMQEALYGAYKWLKPVFFIGMLLFALPVVVNGSGGRFVAFLTVAYFVSAAAFSIVTIYPLGDPRHEDVFSFFPLIVCVLGVAALPKFWRLACANAIQRRGRA